MQLKLVIMIVQMQKNYLFLWILLSLLIYITNILDESHFVCNIFTKQKIYYNTYEWNDESDQQLALLQPDI